jgi:hypothetical protein
MGLTQNARLRARVEQKLAKYCARRGVKRTEAVMRARDQYVDSETSGVNAYSLAADLIPAKGVKQLQAEDVRVLARKAFRGSRRR